MMTPFPGLPFARLTKPAPKWVPWAAAGLFTLAILIFYGRVQDDGLAAYRLRNEIRLFVAVVGLFALTALAWYFTRPRFAFQLSHEGVQAAANLPVVGWADIADAEQGTYPLHRSVIVRLKDNDAYYRQLTPTQQRQGKLLANRFGSPVVVTTFRTDIDAATLAGWINQHKEAPATGYAAYGKDYLPERDDT